MSSVYRQVSISYAGLVFFKYILQ